jgi:uncharacterized protein (DUF362 family)
MHKVFVDFFKDYKDQKIDIFFKNFFLSVKDKIPSKGIILLKPNLLQASVADKAITTHPLFLDKVIKSLLNITDAELILADSPGSNFDNYEQVLRKTGILDICLKYNIEIVKIEKFKPKEKNGFIYSSIIDNVDLIVNLPKLKTHSLTGLTLSVKNLFGLIPGTNKVSFHRKYPKDDELSDSIYKYFQTIDRPIINLLDGILAHEGEGPSRGNPKFTGVIFCSENAVALDVCVTNLLDLNPDFCKTTKAAINSGFDINLVKLEGENKKIKLKLPISQKLNVYPTFIKKVIANNVKVLPVINEDNCINCLLCLKSCPAYAITKAGNYPVIDHNKCVECFCCYEVCESDAIYLKRSLLHRLIVK